MNPEFFWAIPWKMSMDSSSTEETMPNYAANGKYTETLPKHLIYFINMNAVGRIISTGSLLGQP